MTSRFKLSRRTMLRGTLGGAAVSVGLPTLEAMLSDNGTALADGSALPKRFGIFFWANGKPWTYAGQPDLWTPAAQGAAWPMTELLSPLEANRDKINVVTGLAPHTQWETSPPGQEDGHMRGAACALTSARCNPVGFDHPSHTFSFEKPTLDQVVATHPAFYGGSPTVYRSLELGVSHIRFHDYGHWNCISHRGPNQLNLPILDVGPLYQKLFGTPPDTSTLAARATVLDAVREDAAILRRRLGKRDAERMDSHLTHLSEIHRRLTSGAALCTSPGARGDFPFPTPSGQLHAKLDSMVELLAAALQCDLTRVFSIMFTSPATNEIIAEAGATASMHQHCHDGAWEIVRRATFFHMQALNILLTRLRNTADVSGSLLDNTLVYATSEYGEGYQHGTGEFPVILAGNAGGTHKTGYHVREPGGNLAKTHTTILRALGLPFDQYGFNGSETRDDFMGSFVG